MGSGLSESKHSIVNRPSPSRTRGHVKRGRLQNGHYRIHLKGLAFELFENGNLNPKGKKVVEIAGTAFRALELE